MGRIRSIKPEFWTSETIAGLCPETRLTFIGMWNHCDDYGVWKLIDRLIAASLYPMDDPAAALARTRRALDELSTSGRITYYEVSGKKFLHVTSWDEHQKIDRPTKSKLPRPDDPSAQPLTWTFAPFVELSTSTPLVVVEASLPEQGSRELGNEGSREQGVPPTAGVESAPLTVIVSAELVPANGVDVGVIVAEWLSSCSKRPPNTVISRVGKHVKSMAEEGIAGSDIRSGLAAWQAKGADPSSLASFVNQAMNAGPVKTRNQQATDDLFSRAHERALAIDLAQEAYR